MYPKTVFCDIDGVLFKHFKSIDEIHKTPVPEVLPGVVEKFREWNARGFRIVLTTGRPPSLRETTERQITHAGLFYHDLVMGLPRGERIVINDAKEDGQSTARGITVSRDKGLEDVEC